jgi:hypothetical protein
VETVRRSARCGSGCANTGAIRMYEDTGYRVVSQQMRKDLPTL